jgi:hypothetical protein
MATKPTNKAEWATGGASITEPLLAEKQAGWPVAFKPPAQWFNWWMKLVHQWILWLDAFETEAHTWTVLQTFNAGVLAASFGAAPGTPGIRGTNALAGATASAILGSTTAGTGASGVRGTSSSNTGYGGRFENTGDAGIAIFAQANGTTIYGLASGNYAVAGVTGVLDSNALGFAVAGVVGQSNKPGAPGVLGTGAQSVTGVYAKGGDAEDSGNGGLGLMVRGGYGASEDFGGDWNGGNGIDVIAGGAGGDGSLGVGANAGTNSIRGGSINGIFNDEGEPGVGLTIQGGNVDNDSNNRLGAVGLIVNGGVGQAGRGKSIQALGDAELTGYLQMIASTLASNTQQIDLLSPGLMVKAWARVQWTGGGISIIAGQNVSAVGFQTAASGRWYLDLARSVTKTTRSVVTTVDASSGGARTCNPIDQTAGDAFGRSDTRVVFEVVDAATPSTVNLSSTTGVAYVVVMGV